MLVYVKEWKNVKVLIQLWKRCAHVALFETDSIYCLFYFASSDQSKTVDWLKSMSLTRYHVCSRLKSVTKIFLGKVQHKSRTCYCTTDTLHFRVAILICPYRVKQKDGKFDKGC